MKKIILPTILLVLLSGAGCSPAKNTPTITATTPVPPAITIYGEKHMAEIKTLNKAIESTPENVDLYMQRGVAYKNLIMAQSVSSRGDDYADVPNWVARARADFDTVLRLDPKNARAYFERGTPPAESTSTEENIRDLTSAIAIDPSNSDYYYYRGLNEVDATKLDDAVQDFSRALQYTGGTVSLGDIKDKRDQVRAILQEKVERR